MVESAGPENRIPPVAGRWSESSTLRQFGEVAEWLKALRWKRRTGHTVTGPNPVLTASHGEVAEWLKASVLKTESRPWRDVGPNPTLSETCGWPRRQAEVGERSFSRPLQVCRDNSMGRVPAWYAGYRRSTLRRGSRGVGRTVRGTGLPCRISEIDTRTPQI